MVGNLTVGKKKYADVEADIYAIMEKAAALQKELLRLVDEDAVVFEPLSKAYGIPKDDPNREKIMEEALQNACTVPWTSCAPAPRRSSCTRNWREGQQARALRRRRRRHFLQIRAHGREPQRLHQHQLHDGQGHREEDRDGSGRAFGQILRAGGQDLRVRYITAQIEKVC
jgi:hypothetical protein